MLTELQKRKLTAMFHYYDLDGDGILEKADYEEFAKRTCEALGFAPGSPEYDQVYAANHELSLYQSTRPVMLSST